jgi:hypothetical protein
VGFFLFEGLRVFSNVKISFLLCWLRVFNGPGGKMT